MLVVYCNPCELNIKIPSDAIYIKKVSPTFFYRSVRPKLGISKTKKPLSHQNGVRGPFVFYEKKISINILRTEGERDSLWDRIIGSEKIYAARAIWLSD